MKKSSFLKYKNIYKYNLIIILGLSQFSCSHKTAITLAISKAAPITITDVLEPGKIVDKPIILKYPPINDIEIADKKVIKNKNIYMFTLFI